MREEPLTLRNRQALDRQILDNHFRGLIYGFRQIDTGICSPEWQQWYVDTLAVLVAIYDQMPDLYIAAGIDHALRVDNSDIQRTIERQQREKRERERRRA